MLFISARLQWLEEFRKYCSILFSVDPGGFFTSGSSLKLVEIVPKLELGPGVAKKKRKKRSRSLWVRRQKTFGWRNNMEKNKEMGWTY